jgi:hypothetical protein
MESNYNAALIKAISTMKAMIPVRAPRKNAEVIHIQNQTAEISRWVLMTAILLSKLCNAKFVFQENLDLA